MLCRDNVERRIGHEQAVQNGCSDRPDGERQGRDWSAISGRRSGRSPIKAVDDKGSYRSYNNPMDVTFDPVKRDKTLIERGLNFADAALVFEGDTLEIEDDRKDYGEIRIICFGRLAGRLVVGRRLHPAWHGSPHIQHEESQ